MKGIRGANGVRANTKEAILEATSQLLAEIVERNHLDATEVVSALFTLTPDLNAAFPATAARTIGWVGVPLMCAQEIPVPGAVPAIVRVLLLVDRSQPVHHVYLGRAQELRPDLAGTTATEGEDNK